MLINGEKWACEACVRGHRVSNCQHSDRPLQHINKKGRPVSQCQHCRAMRKSRSAHSKCDCGEKTHKCAHLKVTVDGHKESCCCNHGGRCTCSHKKGIIQLNPVPESDSERDSSPQVKPLKEARPRRRANTVHSGGLYSLHENSHRKPGQKHVKSSKKSGPYQLNRVSSFQSATSLGNLSLDINPLRHATGANSPASSGDFSQDHSQARSEAASPLMTGSSSFPEMNGQLSPLDLSGIEYPPYVSGGGYDSGFANLPDHEQPVFSAGLSAATPVDWSHYDGLEFANKPSDLAASSYSQPNRAATYDFAQEPQPTMTTNTSNSAEASEIEDPSLDGFSDVGFVPTSGPAGGFSLGQLPGNLLSTADVAALSYNDLKLIKAGNKFLPTPASLTGEEPVMAPTSSGTVANYQLVDEDPGLWLADYPHGLSGLPPLTDSPDSGLPTFWDTQ